jgi:hypothetical protein
MIGTAEKLLRSTDKAPAVLEMLIYSRINCAFSAPAAPRLSSLATFFSGPLGIAH